MTAGKSLLFLLLLIIPKFTLTKNVESWKLVQNFGGNLATTPYDPEWDMTTPEIIQHRGYRAEIHHVTTADGYILELHRILPRNLKAKSKQNLRRRTVFLQHGLLCASSDWVINPTRKSLAFMLADLGYDVWLGNARGNTYSRRHVYLTENDKEFWKFSWDEMGYYDIPAELDYVLRVSEQEKLIYIGHSMGTTMFWIAMDTHPKLNQKIELMIGLGPVASVAHLKSPIKLLSPFVKELTLVFKILGTKAFLPSGKLFRILEKYLCDESRLGSYICENLLFLLSGSDPENFNKTMLPLIAAHSPAGTSTFTVLHYAQEYGKPEKFVRFDWGPKENVQRYGVPEPPAYNLTNIVAPVILFWGQNDWLAVPQDVEWLSSVLGNLLSSRRVNLDDFNHLDFLWAENVDKLLYNDLIQLLPPPYKTLRRSKHN